MVKIFWSIAIVLDKGGSKRGVMKRAVVAAASIGARVSLALCAWTVFGASASWAQVPPAGDHGQHEAASLPLGVSPNRTGSGTAWLPDGTPMHAVHGRQGAWDLMAHGSIFAQYLAEGGERGIAQAGSINWFMGMAGRSLGGGRLGLRGMVSLEPWSIRGCGYPDLLASGESCNGRPIVDRQHPHDLIMELAVEYQWPLSGGVAVQIYGGPAGEPALGPVAFPHRLSAMPNPLAPISHHWLDATHITYGVITGGLFGKRWKAEASAFNGREPNDDRVGLDLAAPDSVSGRLWFLPSEKVALQISAGRLHEAEAGVNDLQRLTASMTVHQPLNGGGIWASTLAWGRNSEGEEASSFAMIETSVTIGERHTWFARADAGRKPAHDLNVGEAEDTFAIGKIQGGYVRYWRPWRSWTPGIGGTVSMSVVPTGLSASYGGRLTPGFGVFATIRPAAMPMRADGVDPHAGHRMPEK